MEFTGIGRRFAVGVIALSICVLVAACAQHPAVATDAPAGAAAPPPASAAGATSAATATPKPTATARPAPPAPPVTPKSAAGAVPADATVLVASLVASKLGVVTDRDMYGPVSVTDKTLVSRVAAVINSAQPLVPAIVNCPMQEPGGMTLEFETSVGGPPVTTVIINASGCQGILIRPAAGGAAMRSGGPDTVRQIEAILGVDWPKPAE